MAAPVTSRGERQVAPARAWPLLILVVAALGLLWPVVLGGQALLPGGFLQAFQPWQAEGGASPPQVGWNALQWDALAQYYPWRAFAARTLAAGFLPLWNPHQFCGAPFMANGQSAVLYPPNALFWLLPTWRAFGWLALLHLLLAGGGMYLFLRALARSRAAATLGGLSFMLSGFFATWLEMTTVVAVTAWLPLCLWLAERYFQQAQARWALALGAALGLAALAGHPQMLYYLYLGVGAFFVYRSAWAAQQAGARVALRTALGGGAAALVPALLLGAAQLLPLAEYARYSHRTPGGYEAYVRYALPWQQALGAFLPDFFGRPSLGTYWGAGNYAEYISYVGIAPLLLAGLAAWCGRGRHFWFFAGLALFAVLVALGTPLNLPAYMLVPGLKGSGGPARILCLWALALAVMAAYGFDGLRARLASGGMRRAPMLVPLALVGVAFLGMLTVWQLTPGLVDGSLVQAGRDSGRNWVMLLGVGGAFPILVALSRRWPALLVPGLVLLVASDLLLFAAGYNPTAPACAIYPRSPAISAVSSPARGRALGLCRRWPLDRFPTAALPPNWAMVYGAEDPLGYDSLYPARYKALLTALEGRDPSPRANGNMLLAGRPPAGLGILDVAWVMSPQPLLADFLHPMAGAAVPLHEYRGAHSRVWWTPRPAMSPTAQAAFGRVAQAPLVPVLEGGRDTDGVEALPLAASWWRPGPNRMHLRLTAPGRGWLLISEGYFPGWQARVNGRPVTLSPGSLALRLLPVPAGPVYVEMAYRPQVWRLGLFALCLGSALLAGSVGWLAAGRRHHVR